jgi:DNA invertase Pin-like site-specific DNA recombinase
LGIIALNPAYFETLFEAEEPPECWPDAFAIVTAYATTGEKWGSVVRRILLDRGVPLSVRPPVSEEHRKAILKMNTKGKGIKEIGMSLGLSFSTVYRILLRAGQVKKKQS